LLIDSYGAIIGLSKASLTLDGTDIVGHPDSQGAFKLNAVPGTYTLRGVFLDVDAGIRLEGERIVNLTVGQPLNVGEFELSDASLQNGWEKYRAGAYTDAKTAFLNYLTKVRSGQSSVGSTSAYSALGWTMANGFNKPTDAATYFQSALDGWSGNLDARVGFAGVKLGLMKSGGPFLFNDAIGSVTTAIDATGEYSSAPTHDKITEIDLKAFRAFINFLNGNNSGARSEAQAIATGVASAGNDGSQDVVAIVLEFTK
jgi:hypothetical protein